MKTTGKKPFLLICGKFIGVNVGVSLMPECELRKNITPDPDDPEFPFGKKAKIQNI